MIRPRVILGPPGCGKTHRLLELLCGELAGGTPPQRIAFVTFTRAARREALERIKARLGLGEEDMPWVRTIHSTAYRLLELAPGQLMDEELWGAFARRYGYRLSDCVLDLESPFEPPFQQTPEDRARYVHDWGRNCRLDPERALRRCPVEGVKATLYRQFVRRVEGFKREEGLLDFSDLLDQVLARGLRPPVEVLFVDEAQDLSPLQIAVCEQWFAGVQRVYLAGDDDQAIYTFQGADPTWLGELARRGTMEVLEQSHRVPKQPHALAQKVITRNEIRVAKSYEPRPAAGSILRLDTQAALKLLDESKDTFILARNRIFLRPIARELLHRGIAYVVEGRGGPSPLSNRRIVKAINAGSRITAGDIRVGDLHDLLVLVPSGGPLLPRGVKTRIEEAANSGQRISRDWLCEELGLGQLFEMLEQGGPLAVMQGLDGQTRRYLKEVLERHGGIPEPRIRLMSIHASKGRQADLVLVVPDMTGQTFRQYRRGRKPEREAENRVFYVAVTRTRETVALITPHRRRHYDFPRVGLEASHV